MCGTCAVQGLCAAVCDIKQSGNETCRCRSFARAASLLAPSRSRLLSRAAREAVPASPGPLLSPATSATCSSRAGEGEFGAGDASALLRWVPGLALTLFRAFDKGKAAAGPNRLHFLTGFEQPQLWAALRVRLRMVGGIVSMIPALFKSLSGALGQASRLEQPL